MRLFVDFSFNPDDGSFALPIPAFHFVLTSSSSSRSCARSSHRPLNLRSITATNSRATVVRAAGSPWQERSGETRSDEKSQNQGSSSADITSSQGKSPAPRDPSTPSSASSSSSSLSSSLSEKTSKTPGNLAISAVESCSSVNGALPSADSLPSGLKQLSHMSKGIKAAFGVFEGFKVIQKLQSFSVDEALLLGGPGNLVFLSVKATKFSAKGLKMAQKVLTSSPLSKLIFRGHPSSTAIERLVHGDLPTLAKGFNTVYTAIKVAQFTRNLGKQPPLQEELRLQGVNFIWKGYKFSKTVVSILDAVAGKNGWALTYMGKGLLILKKAVGGFGVMAKAMFLSKELGLVVLQRIAISGGTFAVVFGACRHTRKSEIPMKVHVQSRSKQLLCTALTYEGSLCDLASRSILTSSDKDESLSCLINLPKIFVEEWEGIHVKDFEEHDPQMVLCLALPLMTGELPSCV